MVKVYANPELLPMFNLWQEHTTSEQHNYPLTYGEYYLFIQALDEGSNWVKLRHVVCLRRVLSR